MNKGLIAFLGFCGGGVAGFFAGKKLLEEHYNQVVQEEIDSVKKAFRRQMKSMETAKPAAGEKNGRSCTGGTGCEDRQGCDG